MLVDTIIFGAGLFAWTLVEYVIHGTLSHVFATPISPLHDVHHRDPHAIFTIGAWVPTAIVWTVGMAVFGMSRGMIFYSGMVAGFIIYEAVHYRIHFATPATAFEARIRARHLAHHFHAPDVCFGVTTPIWDHVFGSQPGIERMSELEASVANVAPLRGPTNVRKIAQYLTPHASN